MPIFLDTEWALVVVEPHTKKKHYNSRISNEEKTEHFHSTHHTQAKQAENKVKDYEQLEVAHAAHLAATKDKEKAVSDAIRSHKAKVYEKAKRQVEYTPHDEL